jgi:F-type H+-transporting ATPase subunit gamma
MPAQLQVLRRRIRSVKSTKKITKAQELVATSRIAKAQELALASRPYANAITKVLGELARHATVDHPLLTPRNPIERTGVVLVTSDRGLCGAYNANAIRAAERLVDSLRRDGKEPVLYVIGRKGVAYYRFRGRPVAASWTGFSERPALDNAREVARVLIESFVGGSKSDGVDELYLVSTEFRSLMTQTPVVSLVAPMEVERQEGLTAAYDFEPDPEQLLDALLPQYLNTRIYAALLDSAASESASRRRAMKSATDNAEELLKKYTRDMNSARQAAITQEISEIVGGANALAEAGREV